MAEVTRLTQAGLALVGGGDPGVRATQAGLVVVAIEAAVTPVRATQSGLVIVAQPFTPYTPTLLSLTALPASFLAQTSAFSPAYAEPDDQHVSTEYQVADPSDPSFTTPLFTFLFEWPEDLTFNVLDGLGDVTTYLVRVRHEGGVGGWSPWSAAVEGTTLDSVVRPHTPTVTVADVGIDWVTALSSSFSHSEGTATAETFDPSAPLPYLSGVDWQVRSGTTLIADSGLRPPESDPPSWTEPDLADDTAYEIRVRHFDGYYGAYSYWSAWVAFSTLAIPLVRPVAPDVTVTNCGPTDVALASTAFSHPEPAATHAATRWRMMLYHALHTVPEGASAYFVTTASLELLAFLLPVLPPGTWRFYAQHQDDSGRWSAWGNYDECVVTEPPGIPVLSHKSGTITGADLYLTWTMLEVGSYLYHGQVSADNGATWVDVFTDQATAAWWFTIAGRADGAYLLRIRARWADEAVYGQFTYLEIRIDRTGRNGVHYDLGNVTDIAVEHPEWELFWHVGNESEQTGSRWEPIALDLGPGSGLGLVARTNEFFFQKPFGYKPSVLAFTELGEPTQYEMSCEMIFVPDVVNTAHFRFWEAFLLRGGLAGYVGGKWSTVGGTYSDWNAREGTSESTSGSQAWWMPYSPCPKTAYMTPWGPTDPWYWYGGCEPDSCLASSCEACAQSRTWAASIMRDLWLDRLVEYAVSYDAPWLNHYTSHDPSGTHAYNSAQQAHLGPGSRQRGIIYAHRRGTSECVWVLPRYTLRQKVTRLATGGARYQSQLLGPGLDPDGWTMVTDLTQAQIDKIDCGYVGLYFESFRGICEDLGVVFTSFSISNVQYDLCEPPPPPPDPGEAEILEKAWAFVLDGHTFYVLNRASDPAIVCDIKTGQWHMWRTKYPALSGIYGDHWNMFRGIMWKGRVIAADRDESYVWELDPHSFKDEGAFSIERAVTGYQPCRGCHSKRQGSFRITARREDREEVTKVVMRFSDDAGKTWSNDYAVMFDEDSYSKRIEYRSLGRIRAPGRIWEIEDAGGLVRIEGADSDTEGDE